MKKAILSVVLALFVMTSYAQEAKFQAMMVYDFTRMLQWPQEYRQGDFFIKVYGGSDIYDEIVEFTEDKLVRGEQKIVVEKFDISNPGRCHILVIAESESSKIAEVLSKVEGKGTLVVTQKTGLTSEGAGISFIQNGKGRYKYNLANISENQITVSTYFKQVGEES